MGVVTFCFVFKLVAETGTLKDDLNVSTKRHQSSLLCMSVRPVNNEFCRKPNIRTQEPEMEA